MTDANFANPDNALHYTIDGHDLEKRITIIDKGADYYEMNHPKRGLALVFNHYEFENDYGRREGTDIDCRDIQTILNKLHFDVKIHNDLRYGEICQVLAEVVEMDHSDADCLVVVVMSHGDNGVIFAKDTQYPPDILWSEFAGDKCATLAGKPKLFFIQACRGDEADSGTTIKSRTKCDSSSKYTIPTMADILIMYSTYPGHFSFRSSSRGSWFIQSLCKELNERAHEDDILKILTFVNRSMAIDYESFVPRNQNLHKKKQIGVIFSTLTRLLYFKHE